MATRREVLVLGVGRLGASLAERASAKGEDVIVIDRERASFGWLDDAFGGFEILGDATDTDLLEGDGRIRSAKEVIITTGDDNTNLFLTYLAAKIYEVPRIVVRFNDPDKGLAVTDLPGVMPIYPFDLSLKEYRRLEEGEQ